MSVFSELFPGVFIERIGWTLLHSLWQFSAIAMIALLVLVAVPSRLTNVRYWLACGCLLAMTVAFGVTLISLDIPTQRPSTEIVANAAVVAEPPLLQSAEQITPTGPMSSARPQQAPAENVAVERHEKSEQSQPLPAESESSWPAKFAFLLPSIVLIWLVGVAALSIWNLIGWLSIQRLRKLGVAAVSDELIQIANTLAARIGIRGNVRLLRSTHVAVPIVVGWLKPLILLPASLLAEMSPAQLESVLAHELAHIRRHDYLINLIQAAIETVFFYHPAIWWLSCRIRIEREYCCDDAAVRVSGKSVELSEALTIMAAARLATRLQVAAAGRSHSALRRVQRLLDPSATRREFPKAIAPLAVLAALSIAILFASRSFVAAEDRNESAEPDAQQIVKQLDEKCRDWLLPPGPALKSLEYTYHLGNDERQVELVAGVSSARRGMWQGTSLWTGLNNLIYAPDRFDATAKRIEPDATHAEPYVQLIVRPKDPENPFQLAAGNGIDGSWRGYFSHGSNEMKLELDAKTLLPTREIHEYSQYEYRDWKKIGDGKWAPMLVVVRRGESEYRMHFEWQADAVWLLTTAETVREGRISTVARVTNVRVNNKALIAQHRKKQRQQQDARQTLKAMLAKNGAWLAPTAAFDTLEYTFKTEREDVQEKCVVRRDGLAVFEVTEEGKGKTTDRLGDRKIVTADNRTATARRGDPRAFVHENSAEEHGPNRAEQLRRYALIGCQFDMPLFELNRILRSAKVEITDGQWSGVPCHVATISVPPRSAYLGCGVMLGFTSWSYVHHVYPSQEIIYFDKERMVPLHETLTTNWEGRRFEIDFLDYTPIETDAGASLVPLRIELTAKDYFTCRYQFQIVGKRQWLLKSVESWFKPDAKSRGTVEDVQIDKPLPLLDEAERQLQAYRQLFEPKDEDATAKTTQAVDTLPFELGKQLKIGPANLVFTLENREQLIAQCTAEDIDIFTAGHQAAILLLDENDRLVQAGQANFVAENGELVATISFGHSVALRETKRFAIAGLGDIAKLAGAQSRKLRVRNLRLDAKAAQPISISDTSGKTQLVNVVVRKNAEGHPVAAVDFASRDSMNEFRLDVSVAAFDQSGQLLSAAAKADSLLVESHVVDATWEIPLPLKDGIENIDKVAVGFARGQTIRAPAGSLWAMFMDRTPPFPLETLLLAETSGCWSVALQQLEYELNETIDRGLLGAEYNWRDQVSEKQTPADKLRPRADRLLEIAAAAEDENTLASAILLLGYSGDDRAVPIAERLLQHKDAAVQDAAAIALGLLQRDTAIARIDEILACPDPKPDDPQRFAYYKNRRHVLIALATARSDTSIPLVQKWMRSYIEGIEIVETDRGYRSAGTHELLRQLTVLLGRLQHPQYLEILTDSVDRLEARRELKAYASPSELLAAVLLYNKTARPFIDARLQRGDSATIHAIRDSRDPHYVASLRQLLDTKVDANAWYSATRYLWNIGTPEAVDLLRKMFDAGIPRGDDNISTRLRVAEALAHYSDYRGLPVAFDHLVMLPDPGTPPADRAERYKWQREHERPREAALAVFDRAGSAAVADFVLKHAYDANPNARLALLQIVEKLQTLPEKLRPTIEKWAADTSSEAAAQQAARILARQQQ